MRRAAAAARSLLIGLAAERWGVDRGSLTVAGRKVAHAATGRTLGALFSGIYEFEDGKIASFHLYFDQAELFTQLGIAAGSM